MEYYENEDIIDNQSKISKYFQKYHTKLEKMGYDPLLIKKLYAYIDPKTIEGAINFIEQHAFFPDKSNKLCFYCKKEEQNHINSIPPKKI